MLSRVYSCQPHKGAQKVSAQPLPVSVHPGSRMIPSQIKNVCLYIKAIREQLRLEVAMSPQGTLPVLLLSKKVISQKSVD